MHGIDFESEIKSFPWLLIAEAQYVPGHKLPAFMQINENTNPKQWTLQNQFCILPLYVLHLAETETINDAVVRSSNNSINKIIPTQVLELIFQQKKQRHQILCKSVALYANTCIGSICTSLHFLFLFVS